MNRRFALGKKEEAKYMKKYAEGNLWCLNYMDEINSIVEEIFDSIKKYAVTRSTEDDIRIPNTLENYWACVASYSKFTTNQTVHVSKYRFGSALVLKMESILGFAIQDIV